MSEPKHNEPPRADEAEWQRAAQYAEEHASEFEPNAPPRGDLAQHIFDTLLASNRLMAEQLRRAP